MLANRTPNIFPESFPLFRIFAINVCTIMKAIFCVLDVSSLDTIAFGFFLIIWSRVPERTLSPSYPGRGNFKLISLQNQPTVYIRFANPSREARQLGWASCLTSPGRVTLASGATSLHINALTRLAKCRVSRND